MWTRFDDPQTKRAAQLMTFLTLSRRFCGTPASKGYYSPDETRHGKWQLSVFIASFVRCCLTEPIFLSSKYATWQILLTWSFIESFLSKITPRFRAESENWILLCPIFRDKGRSAETEGFHHLSDQHWNCFFQRHHWGNSWETGWSSYGLSRVHRYHLELYWTELNSSCPKMIQLCEVWPWHVIQLFDSKDDSVRLCEV